MKCLLDFDHTLMDTERFIEAVERDGARERMISADIWQEYNVRDFLFPDTLAWLQTKQKADVFIVTAFTPSYGPESEAFQRAKLAACQLDELVEEVVFVTGEKGAAAAKIAEQFLPPEPIVFVDDRIEHCMAVQAALPQAICCLMVRNPAVVGNNTTAAGFPVVHGLADVDAIIESL